MRIVFDTNVLFSAFVSHGACAGLYEECLGRAQIVTSPDILAELESTLRRKAKITRAELRELLRAVRSDAEVINAPPLQIPICRDPDDDRISAVALAAKADAIVTGDQDLLILKTFRGIPILNPRECLGALGAS